MACVPLEPAAFEYGPRDYLNQFLTLISTLRGGDSRFLPLLLAKVNEVLPSMAAPIARPLMPLRDEEELKVEEVYDTPSLPGTSSAYQTPPVSLTNTPTGDSSVYSQLDSPGLPMGSPFKTPVAAPIPRSVPRMPLAGFAE